MFSRNTHSKLTAFVIANVVQSTIWGRQGILKVEIMLYGKLISVLLGTYYVKKQQGQWYPYISSHGYIVFLHDTIAVLVFPLFSVWILLHLLWGMHFMKCRINHINSKCFQLDSFDYIYLHVQASGVQILMLLISMFYIWQYIYMCKLPVDKYQCCWYKNEYADCKYHPMIWCDNIVNDCKKTDIVDITNHYTHICTQVHGRLTHWGTEMHICVTKHGHHWFN